MNKQKGLTPILIIVLIALAVGGYLLYQKQIKFVVPQSVVQLSPSPVASPTSANSAETVYTEATRSANWKTFTRRYFTFMYPSDWKLTDTFERPGRTKDQEENEIDVLVTTIKNGRAESVRFRGEPLDQKAQLEYLHRGMGNNTDQFRDVSIKTIQFVGNPTIEYIHEDTFQNNFRTKYLIIDKSVGSNKSFVIDTPYNDPILPEYNLILSTFKFTQ